MNRKKVSFRDVDDALSWINSQRRAESEIKTFCTCQRAISETIKKGFEGDVLLEPRGEEIKRGLRESLSVGQCRVKGSPSSISTTTSCTWNFYFLCSANGTECFWQLKRITTSIDRRGKSSEDDRKILSEGLEDREMELHAVHTNCRRNECFARQR